MSARDTCSPLQQALDTVEDADGSGGTAAEACVLEAICEGFASEFIAEAARFTANSTSKRSLSDRR